MTTNKNLLRWTRASRDKYGNVVHTSHCGRYTLTTQTSSLSGRWYCLRDNGAKIGTYGSLDSAKGMAEFCEANRLAGAEGADAALDSEN